MSGIFIVESPIMPNHFIMGYTSTLVSIDAKMEAQYGKELIIYKVYGGRAAELTKFQSGIKLKIYKKDILGEVLNYFSNRIADYKPPHIKPQNIEIVSNNRIKIGNILELRLGITNNIGFSVCDEYMQEWISFPAFPENRAGKRIMPFWIDARTYRLDVYEGGVDVYEKGRKVDAVEMDVNRREKLHYSLGGSIAHKQFIIKFAPTNDIALAVEIVGRESIHIKMDGAIVLKPSGKTIIRRAGKWLESS